MRSPLSVWRRFHAVAELVGARRALALTPGWLVYRQFLVNEQDLRSPLPTPPRPAGLDFRLLTPRDHARLGTLNPALDRPELQRRLAAGERCLVGWLDEEPVYYHWWISASPYFLAFVGLPLLLQPGDVLSGETFTLPAQRGRGIGAAGKLAYWDWAREQGYRRDLGFVAVWNAPSRRLSEKLGRRVIARVDCWRLGPRRRFVLHGAARLQNGALTMLPEGGLPDDAK